MINARQLDKPVSFGEAVICFGASTLRFQMTLAEEDAVFIVGLEPKRTYRVEVDDEEMSKPLPTAEASSRWTMSREGSRYGVRLSK